MIYVLAVSDFELAERNRIEAFRKVHEPERAKLVPAHVTMAFALSETPEDEICAHVEAVASDTRAFPVLFAEPELEFDRYESSYKFCMAISKGSAQVKQLHKALYEGFLGDAFGPAEVFRPHMTVATNEERTALSECSASTLGPFPKAGTINALHVVKLRGDRLENLRRFDLMP